MQDQGNDAFQQLLRDADAVGMSEREIVACFSEWLLLSCWRFDGKDFRIFGNYKGPEYVVDVVEEDGHTSFQGKLTDRKRAQALENLLKAVDTKGMTCVRHPMSIDDVPVKDFVSIGEYRPLPDGSDGMIGVSFERFKPLRLVAVKEGRVRGPDKDAAPIHDAAGASISTVHRGAES